MLKITIWRERGIGLRFR